MHDLHDLHPPPQIPLAQNINKVTGPVTDGTYIAFIILMGGGALLALFLVNADKVIREDNTKVILMKNPSWKSEFQGLWETLSQEPWILLLFPMFFSSNIFYTYQNNGMNGAHFNTRTRALNNLLYWLAQIVGAVINGYCLDFHSIRRSVRAKIAFAVLVTLTFVIWGAGWDWQRQQVSREVASAKDYTGLVDWSDGGQKFIGPMFLYFFYGFYDAIWQTCIYWCVRDPPLTTAAPDTPPTPLYRTTTTSNRFTDNPLQVHGSSFQLWSQGRQPGW